MREVVVAQRYCLVKIPRAEPVYTSLSSGVRGRDK
jgi:hypothetical protein